MPQLDVELYRFVIGRLHKSMVDAFGYPLDIEKFWLEGSSDRPKFGIVVVLPSVNEREEKKKIEEENELEMVNAT